IYHLTDCPSFISGDQFMVIEPHERIFNGQRSEFNEGAVRGSFVEGKQGLQDFPDQLRVFSVLENIDFSKPYPGTIFRFPLRTPDQAKASALTKYARTSTQVRQMLVELKDEALKALLFLKHVQKILIYERTEDQDTPTKLFEIEIVNAEEVKAQRLRLLNDFKRHVQSSDSVNQDEILECSVRPTYKLTHEDGLTTEETWQVTTRIGNISKARASMLEDSNGDENIAEHKLIPWVGIAAPTEPGSKIDSPGLFCFLPIGDIQLPFPVHVNGHFAVEQSRRDIWTNTDGKIKTQSSAGIEALWNVHLFDKQIPEAYTLFLKNIGLDHGANYDLWPVSCGDGVGRDAVWKSMLTNMLSDVLSRDCGVFFCGPKPNGPMSVESYSNLHIAGRDLDAYPLLKKALHTVTTLAEDVPSVVLEEIPTVAESLGMASRILTPTLVIAILQDTKAQWGSTADTATRVEMLTYCLQGDESASLDGLPLLPLAGGHWVDLSRARAHERFYVSREVFGVISNASEDLVDLNIEDYPYWDLDSYSEAAAIWSPMLPRTITERIKKLFLSSFYQGGIVPEGSVSQIPGQFPSDDWLTSFWNMAHSLSAVADQKDLLSGLAGVHLIPTNRASLAPLSEDRFVFYLNPETVGDVLTLQKVLAILDKHLGCHILRADSVESMLLLQEYLVDISYVCEVLSVLAEADLDGYQALSPTDRTNMRTYLRTFLSYRASLDQQQQRVLRRFPVFVPYQDSRLAPLDTSSSQKQWRVAQGYLHKTQPWLPDSVNLLAEEQPLKHHIQHLLEVPSLSKSEYLHLLVSQLEVRPQGEWDAILSEVFLAYYEHKKTVDFTPQLSHLAFVQVESPSASGEESASPIRLAPGSVIDPGLSMYFMYNEAVFPSGIYAQSAFRGPLGDLGMRFNFDATFVQERMSILFSPSLDFEPASHKTAALALYDQLNSTCSNHFLTQNLRSMISSLPWIYVVGSSGLCRPSECRPKEDRCLVGDQMPLAECSFSNELLRECMGWTSPPPLDMVLAHFTSMLDQATRPAGSSTTLDDQDVLPIYKYLSGMIQDSTSLATIKSALCDRPWILISGTLHRVDRIALEMDFDLKPHFVKVPASNFDELYLALGARRNVDRGEIETILKGVGSKYQTGERVSKEDIDLVHRLLNAIAYGFPTGWSSELPVLTKDGCLKRAADVLYDDRSARNTRSDADNRYTFIDGRISKDMAQRLQIAMFSVRTWEESRDNAFEPFFQEENIVDRIKGILNDYDPSSILNEFLQNASDAGATKLAVMLDTKSYGTTKVLSKEMEAWQGPALIFYNDAEFSEESFSALCKLGAGNKRHDISKIGRHGLGFNSVYHFTDVPSVVSGTSLVFFDPHMASLPKGRDADGEVVAQKGHRYDFRKLSPETLEDQLRPYMGLFGCDMNSHFSGTIFRIPLRLREAQTVRNSSFDRDGWTIGQVRAKFQSWIEDAKIGLLFLNNVRTIDLSDGAGPSVSITRHDNVDEFAAQLSVKSITSNPCQVSIVEIRSTEAGSGSANAASLKWLLYTEDSMPYDAPQNILNLSLKRHWSTHCGVAIPLGDDRAIKSCRGRLMVNLPTPIDTGFPFHLHGGFALTTNRKTLAGGSSSDNETVIWNTYLLNTRLPLVTIRAYEQLLDWSFRPASFGGPPVHDLSKAISQYFRRWPLKTSEKFSTFLRAFLEHSYIHPVFPCRGHTSESLIVPVAGRDVVLRGHIVSEAMESRVFAWFREGGRRIAETPPEIQILIKQELGADASRPFKQIDCSLLRKRLREDPDFIPRQMKSKDDKQWILEEILRPVDDPNSVSEEPLEGLAIVPLLSGQWVPLQTSPVYYVATREVRDLIEGKNILVDMDLFDSVRLGRIVQALIQDPCFGIEDIRLGVFASAFFTENPHGLSEDKWERLWRYLSKHTDLTPFQELPIVKTTHGSMVTLVKAKEGLQISGVNVPEDTISTMTELFRRLGVAVFDASKHRNHEYLRDLQVNYTDHRVLEMVSKHWPRYAASFVISADEAVKLRTIISHLQHDAHAFPGGLGNLPIWRSFGPPNSPLIPANASFYMKDHHHLDHLGYYPNILRDELQSFPFHRLGAVPMQVATLLRVHIIPKFESEELQCTGHTRAAYLSLFRSLMCTANLRIAEAQVAREVLDTARCFLARDGSFRTLSELIAPGEDLTETIFTNEQRRFPASDLHSIFMERSYRPEFRGLATQSLLEGCANFILEEIAGGQVSAEQTLSRATRLVRYIYSHPGNTDWMESKWKIVPRDLSLQFPYNERRPDFPRYMSFADLCDPTDRHYLWTQRAFFPNDLIPPSEFKQQNTTIGNYTWRECCQHLEVLVKEVAPNWTSTEQKLTLKSTLFKIYTLFEEQESARPATKESLKKSLKEIMTVPYILNGDDKDPSKAESWVYPHDLVFGIDHKIGVHQRVHPSLLKYRSFLVNAGAAEMKHVEGRVQLGSRRQLGDVETRIMACFESQDEKHGFMDVKFVFKGGKSILAHKVFLASTSVEVIRQLTGPWSSTARRDPSNPLVDIIEKEDDYEAFWGLLHFFYTDDLIGTNGRPTTAAAMGSSLESQDAEDQLSERVEYLMALQHLADYYHADRLKTLIAQELMLPGKVIYSNAFDIRAHAVQNRDEDVVRYCNRFIGVKENASLIEKYIEDEIVAVQGKLVALDKYLGGDARDVDDISAADHDEGTLMGGHGDSSARKAWETELSDLKKHLKELQK
ncbi:hypothetical protein BGX23_011960, partial [Mortierella sp. AD031]